MTHEVLNAQQRDAVNHRGSPLIVLAGPGTGKTRVITHRVASLVEEGAAPESIVALTFSVKAAEEMRSRLASLIGPAADALNVATFHSIGQRIIHRFGDLIGLPSRTRVIDSARLKRVLRTVIARDELFTAYAAEAQAAVIDRARSTLSALQDHGVLPELALDSAARWAATAQSDADLAKSEWFTQCARLYAGVDRECRRLGWLTFSDLLTLPIRILRHERRAAHIIRSEWTHFVVDELQDVNPAQIELMRLLAPPNASGAGPDLCVVGDDDQAIYGFRGADELAFRRVATTWPGCTTITLVDNHRNPPAVIAAAGAIIAAAHSRFMPDKSLRCASAAPGRAVECVGLQDDSVTGEAIAAMILTDRVSTPERAWSDYAVIARSHAALDRVKHALELEQIPVKLRRSRTAADDGGVKHVLAWARFLTLLAQGSHGNIAAGAAADVLITAPTPPPAEDIIRQLGLYASAHSRFAHGFDDTPDPGSIRRWLGEHCSYTPAFARLCANMDALEPDVARLPADEMIFRIIRQTGVGYAELLSSESRTRRVDALADLMRFAQDRLDALEHPARLPQFWSFYTDLDDDDRSFGSRQELIEGPAGSDDEPRNAVTLITAHSSKGLEFPVVFLPGCSPQRGYPKTSTDEPADAALPPALLGSLDPQRAPLAQRRIDEERRLFYVACTRAQQRLVLLYRQTKSKSSSVHFVQELQSLNAGERTLITRTGDDVLAEAERALSRQRTLDALDAARPLTSLEADRARAVIDRARRTIRLDAARALDRADSPAIDRPHVASAADALAASAARMAILAHIESHGGAPPWVASAAADVRTFADDLSAALAAARAGPAPGTRFFATPAALPELSYTLIQDYLTCPRCAYLKHFVRFPEVTGTPSLVGSAVHTALEAFYTQFREADSGEPGAPRKPALADLLAMGVRAFQSLWPQHLPVDAAQLAQIRALLSTAFASLHSDALEVLEVEKRAKFRYTFQGKDYPFVGKIDRIDRAPAGGYTIVDYKTGKPAKKLLDPDSADLQLGVYLLALPSAMGCTPSDAASGTAEYWVLQTGERGSIALSSIKLDKVRKSIDSAIEGMLAGDFERGNSCNGLCAFLG